MSLAESLKHTRILKGKSQKQCAEAAGISTTHYQNYEYGLRLPLLPTLIALADLYDISLDELVCRERRA